MLKTFLHHRAVSGLVSAFGLASLAAALLAPLDALALPLYARQTGENCLACHAGGQFPELTPYGRMFKMTGYTIGKRTAAPISVMGVVSAASVADTSKSDSPNDDFQKNGAPAFSFASVFLGGKVTDNIGGFAQITYDNYANAGDVAAHTADHFAGHSNADNIDLRYADRFVDANRDVVFGISLNNNPSVTDPWNTAPAWMQYVPTSGLTSHQFADGGASSGIFPSFGSGGNIAGASAYVFWNRTIYAEVGAYQTANKGFSFMSAGINDANTTKLAGTNPYWRLAYSHEWGAHNIMVGATGMRADVYDLGSDISDPNNVSHFRNTGVDMQYQYLLDPHTVTVQLAYMRQVQDYSANQLAGGPSAYFLPDGVTPVAPFNSSDTVNTFRAKASYVYNAKYGGSFAFFNRSGTVNTLNQTSGYDSNGQITSTDPLGTGISSTRVNGNLTGDPGTRGVTLEAFWLPVQYARVGAQYTAYSKYNGASDNYDGFGRNAKDNNTLFLYVWGAY